VTKKHNRKHSIIDGLPCELKEAVDEMIKSNFTYHEIVDYIKSNGVSISISSVQRYASKLEVTLQSLRLAQENFRAIIEETEKYPNLDITDCIFRLLSSRILDAVNKMPEEILSETDFETLSKNAIALTKAVAYKKNIDIKNKSVLDNGADQFMSYIYETMSVKDPELFKKVKKFIKSETKVG